MKNPMDRGAWWATVQNVATWLSTRAHTFFLASVFPSLPLFLHFFLLFSSFLHPSLRLCPFLSASCNIMVGWHHRLRGHEFEQALGDGEGQGSPACCSPWGYKKSDTTEQLNNNNNMYYMVFADAFLRFSLRILKFP